MRVKEINIKTTDGSWWRWIVSIYEIEYDNDEAIVDTILAETSVPARIWTDDDDINYLDEQMYINTANIVAIEVVR